MKQERDLQASTDASRRLGHEADSTSLRRVLREQSIELGGNIALLEQRYEALPHPERSHAFRRRPVHFEPGAAAASSREVDPLSALIARHRRLLGEIALLFAQRPDGQRGELILAELARSHRRMALALTPFRLNARDAVPAPVIASVTVEPTPRLSDREWENEEGATQTAAFVSADRTWEGDHP